jgi:hypothetical protein
MRLDDVSGLLCCGCYVLLWRGEVAYVGQTENPMQRIGNHSRSYRFDRVWFVPCRVEDLLDLEDHLIYHLRPKQNRTTRTERPPMSLAEAKEFILALIEFPRAPEPGFDLVKAAGLARAAFVPSPDPPNRKRWVPGLRRL